MAGDAQTMSMGDPACYLDICSECDATVDVTHDVCPDCGADLS